MTTAGADVPGNPSTKGLEGFDICESRTRNADGPGFESPQVHVTPLSDDGKKELDEAADKFKKTVGSTKPVKK